MKTAWVLAGGGAKGSFQVGVMQFLHEQGLLPDKLYGTSVGALNASGYAYGGIQLLRDVWNEIESTSDIMKFNWNFLWSKGFYNTKPLQRKIEEIVTGFPKREAVVTRVNLVDGRLDFVSNMEATPKEFCKAVLSSASIPVVMEPVDDWVDGSVREVTPLGRAIDDGVERIIVIMTNPVEGAFGEFKVPHGMLAGLKIGARALDILQTEVMLNDIAGLKRVNKIKEETGALKNKRTIELHCFAPTRLLMDTLDFNQKAIRAGMKQGYSEAKQQWKG